MRELDQWLERAFALEGEVPLNVEFEAMVTRSFTLMFLGALDQALQHAEAALAISPQITEPRLLIKVRNILGGIAFNGGDLDGARGHFQEALRLTAIYESYQQEQSLLHNLGVVEIFRGDSAAALEMFERAAESARKVGDRVGEALCLTRVAQILAEMGDIQRAAQLNRPSAKLLWQSRHVLGLTASLAIEAVIAETEGDSARADRYVEIVLWLEQPLDIEEPQFTTGRFTRYEAIKRRVESRENGDGQALSMAAVGEVIDEIARLPEPDDSTMRPPERATATDAVLTAREIEIVGLIAKGRTNQEIADELFISLRTAQTHVSNVLTKLGLGSRAAIAAYAVRHGLG